MVGSGGNGMDVETPIQSVAYFNSKVWARLYCSKCFPTHGVGVLVDVFALVNVHVETFSNIKLHLSHY